jgi:hemerythrin
VNDENAIAAALNEVVQYTQGHFRREEMLMRLSGYPGYQAHAKIHQQMAARAVELDKRFRSHPKSFRIDSFYNTLCDWLVPHVLHEDAKLKPFVEKLEEAQAA